MGNLFAKKQPKSRVTEQDKAVLQLKQQRDKLKQYQKKIQRQLDKERELAKTLLKDGKKERALLLLKKKRYQESLMGKTDNQLDNIEQMVGNLEFAQIEAKVVEGLKAGNESLKKLQQVMSLEDVEKIMEETREAVEYQNEIDAVISGELTQEDEDAVLAELEEITKIDLPEVPTEKLPDKVPEPEKQLPVAVGDSATVDVAAAQAAADAELDDLLELPDVPSEAPKEKTKKSEERTAVLAA